MLSKQSRLKKKKDFENVSESGQQVSGRFLVLKFANNQFDATRFGFVVSKKISKKAVDRNRIKRRMRNVCKNEIIKLKKGIDIVFFAKKNIINSEFADIGKDIKQTFKRAGLYV